MRLQKSPAVRATLPGLQACAGRYGWPSQPDGRQAPPIHSFTDFFTWVSSYIYGNIPQLRAAEHRWIPVIVRCGKATVAAQEQLQSARRRVFLRQHVAEVRALQAAARALIARAQALD